MAWLVATMAVNADNTVEKVINANQVVPITPEQPSEVMHIDLPAGLWTVSAGLNALATGPVGAYVYFAGSISRYTPNIGYQDGRTAFQGEAISIEGRADPHVPSEGRTIQISAQPGETKPVYLNIWVHQRNRNITGAWAYGWMEARRLP